MQAWGFVASRHPTNYRTRTPKVNQKKTNSGESNSKKPEPQDKSKSRPKLVPIDDLTSAYDTSIHNPMVITPERREKEQRNEKDGHERQDTAVDSAQLGDRLQSQERIACLHDDGDINLDEEVFDYEFHHDPIPQQQQQQQQPQQHHHHNHQNHLSPSRSQILSNNRPPPHSPYKIPTSSLPSPQW